MIGRSTRGQRALGNCRETGHRLGGNGGCGCFTPTPSFPGLFGLRQDRPAAEPNTPLPELWLTFPGSSNQRTRTGANEIPLIWVMITTPANLPAQSFPHCAS